MAPVRTAHHFGPSQDSSWPPVPEGAWLPLSWRQDGTEVSVTLVDCHICPPRSSDFGTTYSKLTLQPGVSTVVDNFYICPSNKRKVSTAGTPWDPPPTQGLGIQMGGQRLNGGGRDSQVGVGTKKGNLVGRGVRWVGPGGGLRL